jgi:hypothetical protein
MDIRKIANASDAASYLAKQAKRYDSAAPQHAALMYASLLIEGKSQHGDGFTGYRAAGRYLNQFAHSVATEARAEPTTEARAEPTTGCVDAKAEGVSLLRDIASRLADLCDRDDIAQARRVQTGETITRAGFEITELRDTTERALGLLMQSKQWDSDARSAQTELLREQNQTQRSILETQRAILDTLRESMRADASGLKGDAGTELDRWSGAYETLRSLRDAHAASLASMRATYADGTYDEISPCI